MQKWRNDYMWVMYPINTKIIVKNAQKLYKGIYTCGEYHQK